MRLNQIKAIKSPVPQPEPCLSQQPIQERQSLQQPQPQTSTRDDEQQLLPLEPEPQQQAQVSSMIL